MQLLQSIVKSASFLLDFHTLLELRIEMTQNLGADISKMAPDLLQAHLAAIVAGSDDAIITKDLNGTVLSWNTSAERIFGYTPAEMIGKSITVLFPPERMDEEPEILRRLIAGKRVDHFETVRVRKDGQRIDISVTISPIRDSTGRVTGASKIARDITLLKRVEQERERILDRERAARTQAERASRVKDEFLATLSHELRTPLNAIMGWVHLLRSPAAQPEDVQQGIETIERNARAQAALIDELLDMSRIINGKLRLDIKPIDLPSMVSDAVESVRPSADTKSIRLQKAIDPKASDINADPSRIQQILWNLLTNALKFTPRGGQIKVFVERIDSHIDITIQDSGEGIPADFIPNLFNRFSQADASTTRRHGGLGLGLAIVRNLVELHGGTVRASSPGVGQGATFVVSLPIMAVRTEPKPDPSFPLPSAGSLPPAGQQLDLTGIKVLVVDDEPDARALLKRVLAMNNATVNTASSAAEAFDLLRSQRPDILLSDIGMPLEDGYDLLGKIRRLASSEGGETPAVALTAFARPEDRHRALMAGFHAHLAKPVETNDLLTTIHSLSRITAAFSPQKSPS